MSFQSVATGAHDDPAIAAFLGLLEADIRDGRHVRALPEELARAMLDNAGRGTDLDGAIEGEVDIG